MTPEEKKRMKELVLLIQMEQDHQRFGELVDELNALLGCAGATITAADQTRPVK